MKRIICIGNRYVDQDASGPRVYDLLTGRKNRSSDVEIIDGGLGGIHLIPFFEDCEKVILVDQIKDDGQSDGIVVMDASEVAATAEHHFGHASGAGYLLRMLPRACEGDLPEISIVGISGNPDGGMIQRAAELTLRMLSKGRK